MSSPPSTYRNPPAALFDLHHGDARRLDELLSPFSSPSNPLLTCTITSPPYGDLKNYGEPDQIGWGQPYDEYLTDLRRVFRAVAKHTRDDGSLWIIADTLRPEVESSAPLRRLQPVPFHIAEELSEVGWTLRDIIIWKKDKTLPWSGRGRLRNAFEYVMLFVKTSDFKYHVDRLREPDQLTEWWVKWPERYNPDGKVPDNVWEFKIPVQGTWGTTTIQHACPLPPDLVERLIYLSTDPGDTVFDPLAGSGVVLAEAERLGRRPIGIEISNKNVRAYRDFVRPEILHRRGNDPLVQQAKRREWLRKSILTLRILKFPSVLMQQLEKKRPDLPVPALAMVLADSLSEKPDVDYKFVSGRITFGLDASPEEREAVRHALLALAERQPASKFGVAATIDVVTIAELQSTVEQQKELFVYPGTRTYETEGLLHEPLDALVARLRRVTRTRPPIVADLFIRERPRKLDLSAMTSEDITNDSTAAADIRSNGTADLAAQPTGTTTNGKPQARRKSDKPARRKATGANSHAKQTAETKTTTIGKPNGSDKGNGKANRTTSRAGKRTAASRTVAAQNDERRPEGGVQITELAGTAS